MKIQSATITNTTAHPLTVGANLMLCLPVEFSMEAMQTMDAATIQSALTQSIKAMVAALPDAELALQVLDFSIEGASSHGVGRVAVVSCGAASVAIRNLC